MEDDIAELQMKIAYQEDTIEKLNAALADQQKQLDQLQFQMRHVVDKLQQVGTSNIASLADETPPPHY